MGFESTPDPYCSPLAPERKARTTVAKAEGIIAARARGEMTSIECVDRLIAALTRENTDG